MALRINNITSINGQSLSISICAGFPRIVQILEQQLFKQNPVFTECYNQMVQHFNDRYFNWPQLCHNYPRLLSCKDVLLSVPVNDVFSPGSPIGFDPFGHDLPFWIEVNNKLEQGRIMLVSQDPLRRLSRPGEITFSTPFGMHSLDYRGNRLPTQIVGELLSRGYSVYLTDTNKLYGEINGNKQNFLCSCFSKILSAEIDFFKPTKIVAVGNVASQALLSYSHYSQIPHPNVRMPKSRYQPQYNRKTDYFVDKILR